MNLSGNQALAIALLLAATGAAQAASMYSVTDLGVMNATALNDSGQVVGRALVGGNFQAVRYDGSLHYLGIAGTAADIDAAGNIVGTNSATNSAFFYDGVAHAVVSNPSAAYGINAAGVIVGNANSHAFVYSGGTAQDIGVLPNTNASAAFAVNNNGVVVGSSTDTGYRGSTHAFLYDGTLHDLGRLGIYDSAAAYDINASGQVVGWMYTSGIASIGEAFMYDGTLHALGILGPYISAANAINDAGLIVGRSDTLSGGQHAFLYQDGAMLDLNTLLLGSLGGVVLRDATDINNLGQIVATASNGHSYLLAPAVPVPAAAWLFGSAVFGLAGVRRTRRNAAAR